MLNAHIRELYRVMKWVDERTDSAILKERRIAGLLKGYMWGSVWGSQINVINGKGELIQ